MIKRLLLKVLLLIGKGWILFLKILKPRKLIYKKTMENSMEIASKSLMEEMEDNHD